MDVEAMREYLPLFWQALGLTVRIGWQGVLLAFGLGTLCAVVLHLRLPLLRQLTAAYIELFRNTPLLVQLFFLYFALPKIGIRMRPAFCGVLGLGLLGGAYMAETIRSGLESIAPIQSESAEALGLSDGQVYRYVILPQTVRRLIPLSINLITRMIKTTNLVIMIGMVEVLKVAQQIIEANRRSSPNAAFGLFAVVLLLYFAICWPISRLAGYLEKRWA